MYVAPQREEEEEEETQEVTTTSKEPTMHELEGEEGEEGIRPKMVFRTEVGLHFPPFTFSPFFDSHDPFNFLSISRVACSSPVFRYYRLPHFC